MTLALARGIVLSVGAIRTEQPEAITVQVEAMWHTFTEDDSLAEQAAQENARQYLCFDLTTGRVTGEHELADYLCSHGMSESDMDWFHRHAVRFDILGVNFYPWSYGKLKRAREGSVKKDSRHTTGDKIAVVVREAYRRYRMPLMITETSADGDVHRRAGWMDETLEAVRALRREGIPVTGYTWFPLFSMIRWDYRTGRRPIQDYLIHLGLYDAAFDSRGILRRRKTPLVDHFRRQMASSMPPVGA